jgi:hypothetical protein
MVTYAQLLVWPPRSLLLLLLLLLLLIQLRCCRLRPPLLLALPCVLLHRLPRQVALVEAPCAQDALAKQPCCQLLFPFGAGQRHLQA